MFRFAVNTALALLLATPAAAQVIDLENARIVDLSHTYDKTTVYWPTSPTKFELTELAYGETPAGYFYSAYTFSMPEHGGTHLDAPRHFNRSGQSTDQIPLGQLVGRVAVIDITAKAATNPDYRLTVGDVLTYEMENGRIPAGTIILLRTGWSSRWPDAKAYLGDDTPGDASNLHFPSYGVKAAKLLIEKRGAKVLGIDTASNDYGQSADFPVHQIMGAANIPGLENLTNLDALPARGATIIALPTKIGGGSGGPVRVMALIPDTD